LIHNGFKKSERETREKTQWDETKTSEKRSKKAKTED
jgi:hypothetical protein